MYRAVVKRRKTYRKENCYRNAIKKPFCYDKDYLGISTVKPGLCCISGNRKEKQNYHNALDKYSPKQLHKILNDLFPLYKLHLRDIKGRDEESSPQTQKKWKDADKRIMAITKAVQKYRSIGKHGGMIPELGNEIVSYLQDIQKTRRFWDYMFDRNTNFAETYFNYINKLNEDFKKGIYHNNKKGFSESYIEFIKYFSNHIYRNPKYKELEEMKIIKLLYQRSLRWDTRSSSVYGLNDFDIDHRVFVAEFNLNALQFVNFIFIYWYFRTKIGMFPTLPEEFMYLFGAVLRSKVFIEDILKHAILEILKGYNKPVSTSFVIYEQHPKTPKPGVNWDAEISKIIKILREERKLI